MRIGGSGATLHQKFGKRPGERFLTIVAENLFQFRGVPRRQDLGSGLAGGNVESQIQRPIARKSKASRDVGKLIGRKSKIQQNAIDRADSKFREHCGKFDIAGVS